MYYLLRKADGEAFCAIVVPEARNVGGLVYLKDSALRIHVGLREDIV